jgi:RNA polymerase sigma-70 factor (ECF subfamily)
LNAKVGRSFEETYERLAPAVYRYLRRLTNSRVQAEDLLQETFFKLHLADEQGTEFENVRAWVFRVATNLARSRGRAEQRASLREGKFQPEQRIADFERDLGERQAIRRALIQLPPRMRQVLLLFSEGFSYREIAEIVGAEVEYVGVLLQRARASFRRHYEERNDHGTQDITKLR